MHMISLLAHGMILLVLPPFIKKAIPLFTPPTCEIQENDKYFEECITEINKQLRDCGTLRPDSLEAMCNEYVASILYTALHIIRDDTKKELSMRPQHEIIREKSEISQASEVPFTIEFNNKALDENSEECKTLRNAHAMHQGGSAKIEYHTVSFDKTRMFGWIHQTQAPIHDLQKQVEELRQKAAQQASEA
ncbi:11069_t:CDS:2 [Ambispora leptoticha]|uniref:11069_t:CDS:1 n=1 Tax=Ambispora leptoticha TaxID=144679 RepID=A0A9N9BML6_9GLOM|nr:11069_t:CDS:2 [Ambispora leptoticha]